MATAIIELRQYKLALSFSLIIALFLAVGITTIKGLFTVGNLTRTIYEHPLVVSNASLIAALNITKIHRSMKDVVLSNASGEVNAALKAVAENERVVYQQLDIIRNTILGEEGQALEKQTRLLFINWEPIRMDVIRHFESGQTEDAIFITKTRGADHATKLETKMMELALYARKKADNFLKVAESSQSRLEKITMALTISGILLSVMIASITTTFAIKAKKRLQGEKDKLQKAFDEIKTLQGILPICSHCKKIRNDKGSWELLEKYIHTHSEAEFSHSICPDCMVKYYPE
ncbi:MAG: MCP four helix bundle domain-containing protein [Desulfobacterales bacterium]|nr:MCP four helix bundle domain-containing protein [Desulfobacterales bacterium]